MKININSYILLFMLTLIITITSFLFEFNKPFIKQNPKNPNYTMIFILRYIHLILFIYFAFYLLFFKYYGIDVYIYLSLVLLMFLSWYYIGCCILTYYELKMYGINFTKHYTTFHPTMYSLFRNKCDNVMTFLGICITLSVLYILFLNKYINTYIKLIYLILYIVLLYDSINKSRN